MFKLKLKFALNGGEAEPLMVECSSLLSVNCVSGVPARLRTHEEAWDLATLTLEAARCNQVILSQEVHMWQVLPLWMLWDASKRYWVTLRTFLRTRPDHQLCQGWEMNDKYWNEVHAFTRWLQQFAPKPANDAVSEEDAKMAELLKFTASRHPDPVVQLAAREYLRRPDLDVVHDKVQAQLLKQNALTRRELQGFPHKQRWLRDETQRVLGFVTAARPETDSIFDVQPLDPAEYPPNVWPQMMQAWLRRPSRRDNDPQEPVVQLPPQEYQWSEHGKLQICASLKLGETVSAPFWQDAFPLSLYEPNHTLLHDWMVHENIPGFLRTA